VYAQKRGRLKGSDVHLEGNISISGRRREREKSGEKRRKDIFWPATNKDCPHTKETERAKSLLKG